MARLRNLEERTLCRRARPPMVSQDTLEDDQRVALIERDPQLGLYFAGNSAGNNKVALHPKPIRRFSAPDKSPSCAARRSGGQHS